MIGKIIIGKSFSGCISYSLEDKVLQSHGAGFKNRAEVLLFNQCYGNKKELIQQFNDVRHLNPKLSKPVLHITLSLAPGEKLVKGILCKMVEDCAKNFGFESNQFIGVSHLDTSHQHLHIIVNRIGFDKKTLSDSNNYKNMASYCRQMEQKYGLQKVLSPGKFLSKEMRQIPRSDSRKEAIKNDIKMCLLTSKNYSEFEAIMKGKSYQVIKGRGIAFIDSKGVYVKGSQLGYSLARIENILALQGQQKQNIIKPLQNNLHQKQDIKFNQIPSKSIPKEKSIKMSTQMNKVMEDLIKPMHSNANIPFVLIKKNKKRKRSQHL
jgi:hypothetical protein